MPWLGGQKRYYTEGYVFERGKSGSLTQCVSFRLPFPLAYSANASLPAGIVAVGGESEAGLSKKVLLLKWDAKAEAVITSQLPELPVALTNAAVTALGNTVYVAGGETIDGVSDGFLVLDVNHLKKAGRSCLSCLLRLPMPCSLCSRTE